MPTASSGGTSWDSLGFRRRAVVADGLRFHVVEGGNGPPVVLMAGFPQTCYAWRRVMPLLAHHHTVIAVDLPGQGNSEKPIGGYDTMATAKRIHHLIGAIGYNRYFMAGHDIGAWVAYPYAATYGNEIAGLVLLDANIPGVTLPSSITLGPDNWRNWHFLFNPIADLPEALLQGRERVLIEWFFSRKTANPSGTFTPSDIDEYERAYSSLGGMRGMLGYYRAVLEDIEQNRLLATTPIVTPILALGGDVGSAPDIHAAMKPLGKNVQGGVIANCGHYIPEEQPVALAEEMLKFFAAIG